MPWLRSEIVKFAVSDAAEECTPFFRGDSEHGSGDILAVAHTDLAALDIGDLDAIAISMAQ
jgi:hypothetical protein